MFPDTLYAPAVSPFEHPVPLVMVEPTATPALTVSVPCAWLPYVRGALQTLLLQATWDTNDPAALLLQQERAFGIIDLFRECPSSVLPFACPYDWSIDTQGWTLASFGGDWVPGTAGQYVFPLGFIETLNSSASANTNFRGMVIIRSLAASFITSFTIDFDWSDGGFVPTPEDALVITALNGGSTVASLHVHDTGLTTGANLVTLTVGAIIDQLVIALACGITNDGSVPSGSVTLRRGTLNGIGAAPC